MEAQGHCHGAGGLGLGQDRHPFLGHCSHPGSTSSLFWVSTVAGRGKPGPGRSEGVPCWAGDISIWFVLIPGLRSSEGPGKLQGGEGKAALQTSSLASTPTPHKEAGGRPRERGSGSSGREKAVTILSSFWYKRLLKPMILPQ